MEKFKKLLEHWIEHNEEHIEVYKKWANSVEIENAELLKEAIKKFEEGNNILKNIYEKINK